MTQNISVLALVNGTTVVDLIQQGEGIMLAEWLPAKPTLSVQSVVQSWDRRNVPVDYTVNDAVEVMRFHIRAKGRWEGSVWTDAQARIIEFERSISNALIQGINYWTQQAIQPTPTYIMYKAKGSRSTQYAVIKNAELSQDPYPFGQPFALDNGQMAMIDKSLTIYRGDWQDVIPGTSALLLESSASFLGVQAKAMSNIWNGTGWVAANLSTTQVVVDSAATQIVLYGTVPFYSFSWRLQNGGVTTTVTSVEIGGPVKGWTAVDDYEVDGDFLLPSAYDSTISWDTSSGWPVDIFQTKSGYHVRITLNAAPGTDMYGSYAKSHNGSIIIKDQSSDETGTLIDLNLISKATGAGPNCIWLGTRIQPSLGVNIFHASSVSSYVLGGYTTLETHDDALFGSWFDWDAASVPLAFNGYSTIVTMDISDKTVNGAWRVLGLVQTTHTSMVPPGTHSFAVEVAGSGLYRHRSGWVTDYLHTTSSGEITVLDFGVLPFNTVDEQLQVLNIILYGTVPPSTAYGVYFSGFVVVPVGDYTCKITAHGTEYNNRWVLNAASGLRTFGVRTYAGGFFKDKGNLMPPQRLRIPNREVRLYYFPCYERPSDAPGVTTAYPRYTIHRRSYTFKSSLYGARQFFGQIGNAPVLEGAGTSSAFIWEDTFDDERDGSEIDGTRSTPSSTIVRRTNTLTDEMANITGGFLKAYDGGTNLVQYYTQSWLLDPDSRIGAILYFNDPIAWYVGTIPVSSLPAAIGTGSYFDIGIAVGTSTVQTMGTSDSPFHPYSFSRSVLVPEEFLIVFREKGAVWFRRESDVWEIFALVDHDSTIASSSAMVLQNIAAATSTIEGVGVAGQKWLPRPSISEDGMTSDFQINPLIPNSNARGHTSWDIAIGAGGTIQWNVVPTRSASGISGNPSGQSLYVTTEGSLPGDFVGQVEVSIPDSSGLVTLEFDNGYDDTGVSPYTISIEHESSTTFRIVFTGFSAGGTTITGIPKSGFTKIGFRKKGTSFFISASATSPLMNRTLTAATTTWNGFKIITAIGNGTWKNLAIYPLGTNNEYSDIPIY